MAVAVAVADWWFVWQLDIRTDSAELKESLASLSTFYTHKNTVESRRQLRSELEAEGLRIARDFIGEFADLEAVSTGVSPSKGVRGRPKGARVCALGVEGHPPPSVFPVESALSKARGVV